MSECQGESVSWTRHDCCLCVCEWGSGTELEGVEIAKRRDASNCFHFSVMIEEEREHRSAGSLRGSNSSERTCWVYLFTSSSPGRLHSCVREYSKSIRGLPILQERDVIALFTQQGPFLSLQKVPVGLAALLPVPQHQNLQSKSQLCLLCVCHNNTNVSIGSIVFVVMQLCHLSMEDANVHVLLCCRLYFRFYGLQKQSEAT